MSFQKTLISRIIEGLIPQPTTGKYYAYVNDALLSGLRSTAGKKGKSNGQNQQTDQDDRRLFYFLQDVSLLRTAWEEAILASGRTWRIFYWYLNLDAIEESANEVDDPEYEPGLYDALPQDVWSRDEIKEEGS